MARGPRSARLHELVRDFDRLARPSHGLYAHESAIADEHGPLCIPPPEPIKSAMLGKALGLGAAAGLMLAVIIGRRR